MTGIIRHTLWTIALVGLSLAAVPAWAGQVAGGPAEAVSGNTDRPSIARSGTGHYLQVATHRSSQTANLPVGTVLLRVIPNVGAQALRSPITWRVMTFGRDESGVRHLVAEVTEPTPELVLPAGWYVVHAKLPDQVIKHPVEVTAGRTFKYTLVKNHAQ